MIFNLLFSGDIKDAIITLLMWLPIILLSLSLHEAAHAFLAYKLGDPTARNLGRLTLNPVKHLDPFGFLSMLLIGIGWAKPVPINARNFKNPRNGMAISALAGPVSNLLLALVFAALGSAYLHFIVPYVITPDNIQMLSYFYSFFFYGAYLNVSLAVFNLIPAPPFDGSRILYIFLPAKYYFKVMKYERYIGIGIMVIFIACSYLDIDLLGFIVEPIVSGIFLLFGIR